MKLVLLSAVLYGLSYNLNCLYCVDRRDLVSIDSLINALITISNQIIILGFGSQQIFTKGHNFRPTFKICTKTSKYANT